ncbi:MAG TPA: hypothetical protein VKT49_12030 [Bryobacteraceae bacterium]|nr:hypothetical protein [Bryobacteraceae bacterium]
MPNRFRSVPRVTVILPAALLAVFASGQPAASSGQFPPYRASRLDGHPDLNGLWQALVTANWDMRDHEAQSGLHPELEGAYDAAPAGQSIIEGGVIPYQDWAVKKQKENFQNRGKVDVSNDDNRHALGDPELKCYMPGVPRATYMPFPFRIVQGSSPYILIAYEFTSATRIIRMNWKQEAPTPSWMGWSRGHWEGDTLVVDVTGQREESWFDRAGDFHSDALHVTERYTPASPYHLMYQATIEDPKVYTRPWKISFPLYRRMEKDAQLLEFKCVPFTEDLLFGRFGKTGGSR